MYCLRNVKLMKSRGVGGPTPILAVRSRYSLPPGGPSDPVLSLCVSEPGTVWFCPEAGYDLGRASPSQPWSHPFSKTARPWPLRFCSYSALGPGDEARRTPLILKESSSGPDAA